MMMWFPPPKQQQQQLPTGGLWLAAYIYNQVLDVAPHRIRDMDQAVRMRTAGENRSAPR